MDISTKIIKIIKKDKSSKWSAYLAGLLYFIIYLVSIENIILTSGKGFSFLVAQDWTTKLFQQKVAFLWEPIGTLSLGPFSFFISIPNLLIAVLLGLLVALNILIAVFSYRLPKVCNVKHKYAGVLGFLPATLTGFACCAPTFLLALGPLASVGLTAYFITLRPFLIPLSVLLMIGSLIWMLKKIPDSFLNN